MTGQAIAKKLGLSVFGLTLGLLLAWGIGRICALGMGIRDPDIRHVNQIGMWQPHPLIGFVNKPNFRDYCFGTVEVSTNEHGFRGTHQTSLTKDPRVLRIIGLGDSVMWGTGVAQEDSFLGLLENLLRRDTRAAEVINAGVVGYATYQEFLLLRDQLLRFEPDVLLLNFCVNDLLPTENPAGNARLIYVPYLNGLLEHPGQTLNQRERQVVRWLLELLPAAENVWRAVDWDGAPPFVQQTLFRVLIELPTEKILRLCRENGIRLVFLIIPTRDGAPGFRMMLEAAHDMLNRLEIESLDFSPILVDPPGQRFLSAKNDNRAWKAVRYLLRAAPFRDLDNIMTLRGIEYVHENYNFVDYWHPSRRGNRIIAQEIFKHLTTAETPQARTSTEP